MIRQRPKIDPIRVGTRCQFLGFKRAIGYHRVAVQIGKKWDVRGHALDSKAATTLSNMTRPQCLAEACRYFDDGDFFYDLARRVAFRTEGDGDIAPPALTEYLQDEIRPSLELLGFGTEIWQNPIAGKGPLLLARRVEDPALPTVLTYGHGDVVSGQETRWNTGLSPWNLKVDGDRWYGRGTADNKGQHTINFAGLKCALNARGGRLGYNVSVLIETGEEAGSPGLHAACLEHRDALRADLLLACDGPRVHAQSPTLFLGSRGAVNFSLHYRARDKAYHSGNWGGVLVNPATLLAHAFATMVDRRGSILVNGLRPSGIPESVRTALRNVRVGGGEDDPAIDPDWGEPALSPAERLMAWNTIEILATHSGSPQRPINAIPSEAVLHCQLRYVAGSAGAQLEPLLREHLDAQGYADVEVNVRSAGIATRLDLDNPWVQWVCESVRSTCDKEPTVLPNLAGSLPNDVFSDVLSLPTVWVPHSYPACAQHAPNEHLLGSTAREGLQLMAGLYWDLGEPEGPPWLNGQVRDFDTLASGSPMGS